MSEMTEDEYHNRHAHNLKRIARQNRTVRPMTDPTTDALLACPHGVEARIINIGGPEPYSIYVGPDHRCLNLEIGWFKRRADATAAWNAVVERVGSASTNETLPDVVERAIPALEDSDFAWKREIADDLRAALARPSPQASDADVARVARAIYASIWADEWIGCDSAEEAQYRQAATAAIAAMQPAQGDAKTERSGG